MSKHKSPNIEIIYDPRITNSALPVKSAAAIAVYNEFGQVLIARRSNIVDEFKGVWSFPSVFVSDEEDTWEKIHTKISEWLALEVDHSQLIGMRMGYRPKWQLLMHLFSARKLVEPTIQTPKYDALQWVNGRNFFSQFRFDGLGECAKSYLDYLNTNP